MAAEWQPFTMAAEWEFLQPWYPVMRDSLMDTGTGSYLVLGISFVSSRRNKFYVDLPIDANSRRNVGQLQQLREAMELFTALSVVNNRAFADLFPPDREDPQANGEYYYPEWELCLEGSLASDDPAATQSPVSWGALLGFPDDPSSYSVEFRAAFEKLRALGPEEATNNMCVSFEACWSCDFYMDSIIDGIQEVTEATGNADLVFVGLQKFFSAQVPPIFHFQAARDGVKPIETWQHQQILGAPCKVVRASISDITEEFPKLAAALVATSTISLSLSLSFVGPPEWMNGSQVTPIAGFFLNTVLCVRPLSVIAGGCRNDLPLTRRVNYGELSLSCGAVPDMVYAAVCSAVAELSYEAHLHVADFDMHRLIDGRWSWLTYALCCGASNIDTPSVKIQGGTLTRSNLSVIEEVLRTSYPRPVDWEQGSASSRQYGFVDISEGATLEPCGWNVGNTINVTSDWYRCRALCNPAYRDDCVEMIVPGYGACEAKRSRSMYS